MSPNLYSFFVDIKEFSISSESHFPTFSANAKFEQRDGHGKSKKNGHGKVME